MKVSEAIRILRVTMDDDSGRLDECEDVAILTLLRALEGSGVRVDAEPGISKEKALMALGSMGSLEMIDGVNPRETIEDFIAQNDPYAKSARLARAKAYAFDCDRALSAARKETEPGSPADESNMRLAASIAASRKAIAVIEAE